MHINWDLHYEDPGVVTLGSDYDYTCEYPIASVIEQGSQHGVYSVKYTPTGLYTLYIWHYGWPDSVHVTMSVQRANDPERVFPFTIGPYQGHGVPPGGSVHLGEFWTGGIPFTTPFARSFTLNVGKKSICPSETNPIGITERNDLCTGFRWYPATDPVTLKIKSGGELGEFVGPGNTPLGGAITMLASEMASVRFVVGESGSAGGTVELEASCKGIVERDSFEVRPFLTCDNVDHFSVTVTPDTILFNDYCFISGVALDRNGDEVALDPGTPITLMAEPNTIGMFYQDVVTYGQLKAGDVVYYGDQAEPVGVQDVIITVSGDGRSGSGKVVVKPSPCLLLQLLKPKIGPGESVSILLWARQFDGTLTKYESDQMFIVELDTDMTYGKLRSGWGDEGSSVFGPEPFSFIAADSLGVESKIIQITATVSNGGVSIAAREGPTELLRQRQKLAISKLQRILSGDEVGGTVLQPIGKLAVKGKAMASVQTPSGSALLKKLHPPRKLLAEGEGCVPTGTVMVAEIDGDCGTPKCGSTPTILFAQPYNGSTEIPRDPKECNKPGDLAWTSVLLNPGGFGNRQLFDRLFSFSVCADQKTKQWRFHLTSLGFAYTTGFCEINIASRLDIGDGRGSKVTAANYCDILDWLADIDPKNNQPHTGPYYSSNIVLLHESFHLERLDWEFRFRIADLFIDAIGQLTVPVQDCAEESARVLVGNESSLHEWVDNLMLQMKETSEEIVQEETFQFYSFLARTISERAQTNRWNIDHPCEAK